MTIRNTLLVLLFITALYCLLWAQSYGSIGLGPIAPTVANCPPAQVTAAQLCPVGSGSTFQMYVSYNGGAYAPLTGQVTSFNGRTGAVTLTKSDVTGTGISATTTASTTLQ